MLTKTRPMRRKKKTIARLVDDAAVLLQKIRRMESADENGYCRCVTCGKVEHYKNMDGGHYIPRTKTATKLERYNINVQCKSCNMYRKEESKCKYSIYMIETYGYDYVKWLNDESKKVKKWVRSEVEDIIQRFKAELKELE